MSYFPTPAEIAAHEAEGAAIRERLFGNMPPDPVMSDEDVKAYWDSQVPELDEAYLREVQLDAWAGEDPDYYRDEF
jgi:hypothetical protein